MIILSAGQKGGSGKTTFATNLGVELKHRGHDVIWVDADPQATLSRFYARRTKLIEDGARIPEVPCVQKTGMVAATLRELTKRYEIVICDCGGRDSPEFRNALTAADILMTPVQASQPDIETLYDVDQIVGMAKCMNESLVCYGYVNRAQASSINTDVRDARELLSSGEFAHILPSDLYISDLRIYKEAMKAGLSVVEMKPKKAAAEVQLFIDAIFTAE